MIVANGSGNLKNSLLTRPLAQTTEIKKVLVPISKHTTITDTMTKREKDCDDIFYMEDTH